MILGALTHAKAFADLADWRKIYVTGRDSLQWLDEFLTARVSALSPGRAQRCLLLDDSGGLRADVTVAVQGSSVVVLQDPAQLRPIDDLLSSRRLTRYKEGRRTLVLRAELEAWLQGRTHASPPPAPSAGLRLPPGREES